MILRLGTTLSVARRIAPFSLTASAPIEADIGMLVGDAAIVVGMYDGQAAAT